MRLCCHYYKHATERFQGLYQCCSSACWTFGLFTVWDNFNSGMSFPHMCFFIFIGLRFYLFILCWNNLWVCLADIFFPSMKVQQNRPWTCYCCVLQMGSCPYTRIKRFGSHFNKKRGKKSPAMHIIFSSMSTWWWTLNSEIQAISFGSISSFSDSPSFDANVLRDDCFISSTGKWTSVILLHCLFHWAVCIYF